MKDTNTRCLLLVVMLCAALGRAVLAHEGPPFPIVTDRAAGPYEVSVWTDPDTTDDGTPGGQFWVYVNRAGGDEMVPAETRTTVWLTPLDRDGPIRTGSAEPVEGRESQYFAALLMDHEGRFGVRVAIDGPLGPAEVASEVEGTYDQRPPPMLLLLFVMPFALVGFLWEKLLLRRRRGV